jgi:hypothetical protein
MRLRHVSRWRQGACIVMAIFLFAAWAQAQPQGSPQDLQQLKTKLQQLDQEMQELKAQIDAVERAEKSPTVPTTTTPSVPVGATGRPAKETKQAEEKNNIDLYGFIMLDTGYDFKTNDPDWFDVVRPTKLPSFSGEFAPEGKVYYGVRQSRFGVKTSTLTRFGCRTNDLSFTTRVR